MSIEVPTDKPNLFVMENRYWKKSVGTLIGAIWLYTLADIAGSVTEFVNGLLSPGGMMGMLASVMGEGGGSAFGLGDLLEYLFPLLVLLGYWLFYSALTDFMRLQRSDADRESVGKVRKSYILMVVAVLVGYLWIPGKIVALVLTIVAYVKMLSGYRSLKRSTTFPGEARRGAGLLFASTIWLLVGYVIGIIPIVGDAVESVIGFVAFFCVLVGWGRIRRGAPELNEAEAEVLEREEAKAVRRSVVPVWWFPVYIGLFLISCIVQFSLHMEWLSKHFWNSEHPYFGTVSMPLLSNISNIVCRLLIIGACCFLLGSKKIALSSMSRIGLILVVVMTVLTMTGSHFIYLIPFSLDMPVSQFYMLWSYVILTFGCLCIVGIMLFVWSTNVCLTVKISLTVYEILGLAGSFLFALYWMWANNRFPGDREAAENFVQILNSSYYLMINALAFITVLTGMICRQRKPLTEQPAA